MVTKAILLETLQRAETHTHQFLVMDRSVIMMETFVAWPTFCCSIIRVWPISLVQASVSSRGDLMPRDDLTDRTIFL